VLTAKGAREILRGVDLNGDGDRLDTISEILVGLDANHDGDYLDSFSERGLQLDLNGNGLIGDLVSEVTLNRDINGDGDKTDVIHESAVDLNQDGDYTDTAVNEWDINGVGAPAAGGVDRRVARDLNGNGDALDTLSEVGFGLDLNGDGDALDTYREALRGSDLNGDGDIFDSVSENQGTQATGYITIQSGALPASNFALRALRDISLRLAKTGGNSDLTLSGFVGGLTGFDPAANVTIDVTGNLKVLGGIVSAKPTTIGTTTTGGSIQVTAASVTIDGASVFIADHLDVQASGAILLNTVVASVTATSTGSGNITINESDALVIDSVTARSGAITVRTGGDTYVRELRNYADIAGANIDLRVNGNVYVDLIEAATDAGATKRNGNITVEATGNLSEWEAPVRDASGTITGHAYDQTSADLYGYTVKLIGSPTLTPVWLLSSTQKGTGAELEVRVISSASAAFTVTTQDRTLSNDSIRGLGGASVSINSTTSVFAGTDAYQRNRIAFGALTQAGYIYTVRINGGDISYTSTGTDMSTVLQGLATAIETKLPTTIGVTVDAASLALILEAVQANTAFTVDSVTVTEDYIGAILDAVADQGVNPVTQAGSVVKQTSTVNFGSAQTVAAGQWYSVMVNGHDYAVAVGENASVWVNTAQSVSVVAKEWGAAASLSTIVAGSLSGALGTASVSASTLSATAMGIALGGVTVVQGNSYTVTIAGTVFTVDTLVGNTDTPATLASQLRLLINADADYTASLSGTTVSVVRKDNTVVGTTTTTFTGASLTQSANTSQPLTIDVAGWTPVWGATYAITIGSSVFNTIAASGETDATLAEKLRLAIDASSTYVATLTGTAITVTLQAGSARVTDATTATQTPPRTLDLSTMVVVSGGRYTVAVGGVSVNLVASSATLSTFVTDLTTALNATSDLNATSSGSIITLIDADGATGVDPLTATISSTVQSLQPIDESGRAAVTASTEGGQRVSLTGLPVRTGVQYTITIGLTDYQVTAVGGDTLASVADKLVAAIGGTASATKTTVASSWSAVNGALDALIEKGEALVVQQARPVNLNGIIATDVATYTLNIGSDTVSFTAEAGMSGGSRVSGLASALVTKYNTTYGLRIDDNVLWITSGAEGSSISLSSTNVADELFVESAAVAARRLTLVADAANTAFVVNGAAITPMAALAAQPIHTTQVASGSLKQITDVGFAGDVSANMLYTVVLNGKAYTVRTGDNLGLKFTGSDLGAQDTISLTIADEAGVAIVNADHRLWLSNVQATPAGLGLPRVLNLSGLPVAAGYVYTVTVGGVTGDFTAVAASTAQNVLDGLVASMNLSLAGTNITAAGLSATVAASWTGVLGALNTLIAADGQVTAANSATALTLGGVSNNVPFVVNAVYATPSTGLAGDPGLPLVQAGFSTAQVSKLIFADDTVAADDFQLANGFTFAVSMGSRSYSVSIGQGGVTANWTSVLSTLASLIQSGENAAVDAGYAAAALPGAQPYAGTKLTVTSDAAVRSITLTAQTQNMAFAVGGVAVTYSGNRAVIGAVNDAGATPTINAGAPVKQKSSVSFAGATVSGSVTYTVSVNGIAQSVKVGDAIPGAGTVASNWTSVLGELARKLNAAGVVTATVLVDVINLEAVAANVAFTLSAFGADGNVTSLSIPGDYVLVLPSRPAGSYSLSSAGGSLTVVNLPTNTGETITLGAAKSLVVVSPITVGADGGAVTLTAGAGLTLGGKLTAGQLNATAGADLSMSTQVGVMNITLHTASGATPSNLTINQAADGPAVANLTINALDMSGGNVEILADGDVIINSITGSLGNLRIISTGGNVWIKSMADGAAVSIVASGYVTLGNRAAWAAGAADTTVEASNLSIEAGGDIIVFEKDAVVLDQILSTGKGAVTVQSGGAMTLKAAIDAVGKNVSLRTTAGALELYAAVSSGGGSITLDAAAGLKFSELADLSSTGGAITLDAGTGALTMVLDTLVDTGAGQLSLDAAGLVTLGQLRTSFTGDLIINGRGVVAQADGIIDILAPNATLKIKSSGGIGTVGNALEAKVKIMDLWNTDLTTSAIVVEQTGTVDLQQVRQAASGGVDLRTLAGDITVLDLGGILASGIHATSGSVSLYAGDGSVSLHEDITTTGGAVSVVAESGDILLDGGIRVVGTQVGGIDQATGSILLRAVDGSILTASSAAQWLKDGLNFDADAVWALVNGRYQVDIGTGQVRAKDLTASESLQHNLANGAVLRAADGAYLQATGGDLTLQASGSIGENLPGLVYSPLAVLVDAQTLVATSSSRSDVTVIATGAIAVGTGSGDTTGSKGGSTNIVSLSGTQSINSPMDAAGQDITIAANHVNISGMVRSADATLTIRPLDPNAAIVVGDMLLNVDHTLTLNTDIADTQTLNIDRGDISNLGAGFGQIVIGADGNSNPIYVTSSSSAGLVFNDPLKMYSNGVGGEIFFGTNLTAQSLILYGSGHTTTFTDTGVAYEYNLSTDALFYDSVRVDGNVGIRTTTGSIVVGNLGNKMFGDTFFHSGVSDTLTLQADAGNILFNTEIGATTDPDYSSRATENLKGLTIANARDVSFKQAVTIDGDLVINATGKVTFAAGVTLLNGGSLIINGASEIVFNSDSSVDLQLGNAAQGGALLLEADEIQLPTVNPGVIKGTGAVTLRQTSNTQTIAVGSPQGVVDTTGILSLSSAELLALSSTFSQMTIGHASAGHADATYTGAITVGGANITTATDPLFFSSVSIYGNSITVSDYVNTQYTLALSAGNLLKLDATADITIVNDIEADSIELYSASGSVTQTDTNGKDTKTGEAIRSLELVVRASTGVTLNSVETTYLDVQNTATGDMLLGVNAARTGSRLTETQITGDVNIVRLAQTTAAGGDISLTTRGGTQTVLSGTVSGVAAYLLVSGDTAASVTNAGTGSGLGDITLIAQGTGEDILVNMDITGVGALTLTAADAITTSAGSDLVASGSNSAIALTATAGDISLSGNITSGAAATGGQVSLIAGAALTMTSGTSITTLGTSGRVSLQAGGDVSLSKVQAGATVSVTSSTGAIIDNLAGDTPNVYGDASDLVALTLSAATGIGSTTTPIQTSVAKLEALNSTSGGLYLREATALEIAGSNLTPGVNLGGSSGALSLVLTTGNLTVTEAIQSTASGTGVGNILVQTESGALSVQAGVTSYAGNISLLSSLGISLGAQITASTANKSVELLASAGHVTMLAAAGLAASNSGALRVMASGNIVLGQLNAGTGAAGVVSLNAGGSITDADLDAASQSINVTAYAVRFYGTAGVGTSTNAIEMSVGTVAGKTVTANSGIFLNEFDGLTVGTVSEVTVNRVDALGASATSLDVAAFAFGEETALSGITTASGGALVLRSGTGAAVPSALLISAAITAPGAGDVLIENAQSDVLSTLTVNAAINAGSGNVSVLSRGSQMFGVDGDISTTGGTIDVQSTLAGADITMDAGTVLQTNSGNIRVAAASSGNITLGLLDARTSSDRGTGLTSGQSAWGSVSLTTTGGSILGSSNAGVDVYATSLKLNAPTAGAVGAASNQLMTEVSLVSGNVGSGGLFLTEATDLTVGQTASFAYQRVGVDGAGAATADAAQDDLVSAGKLVLQTTAGSIITTVTSGDISAAGNLLVQANGGSLNFAGNVSNSAGHTSLVASGTLTQTGNITTSGSAGTVELIAGGAIAAATINTSAASTPGNVLLYATTGDIGVQTINAGSGNVAITALGGNVTDNNGATLNITATGLILSAASNKSIGLSTDALEISVTTLSATAGTGLFLAETDGITIGSLTIASNRIDTTGTVVASVPASSTATLAGLTTTANGNLVLDAAGSLTVSNAVSANGSGNVRLHTSTGTLAVNANVGSGTGNITLLNDAGAITQGAVAITTDGGSIDIQATNAVNGSVTLVAGSTIVSDGATTAGGNIRIQSGAGMAITGINAGTANVSLVAGGAISDSGESSTDIVANNLRVNAGAGVGEAAGTNSGLLDLSVTTLSVGAGGAVYLSEASAITVGSTAAVTYNRVGTDGVAAAQTEDTVQEDIRITGTNSHLVLTTVYGAITLGGTDAVGIIATGNILLSAGETAEGTATDADITLNASITSSTGHISLIAKDSITQTATTGDITASGSGKSIDLKADGAISMGDDALTQSSNGNVRYEATAGDITLGEISTGTAGTTTGKVAILATAGAILDLGTDTSVEDITAADLILTAGTRIAVASNALETRVAQLSTRSANGGSYITETDALTVTNLSLTVERVLTTGLLDATQPSASQEDLVTLGTDSHLVLITSNGAITVGGGSDAVGISATGNILLSAGETAEGTATDADITLNASVTSTTGNISVLSKDNITQTATIGDITASGSDKTIDLRADDAITMGNDALTQSSNGNVRYEATAGNITLAEISTGTAGTTTGKVAVIATAGSILDLATDTSVADITAGDLILSAGTAIGASANRLETATGQLSTRSSAGGTFLSESDSVTVTALSLTVNRVDSAGAAAATAADTQQDLVTVGAASHLFLVTVAGGITVEAGTATTAGITAAGDLLLFAGGASSDVTLNADASSAGTITVNAGHDLVQSANLTASADSKTIDIVAGNAISMAQNSAIQSTAASTKGNIRLQATAGNITLEKVDAGTSGSVSIIATAGSILDGDTGDTEVDIIANGLLLNAAITLGAGANHLETTVATLTANATGTGAASTNGVFVTESDGLTLDAVDVDAYRQASVLNVNLLRTVDFSSVVLPGSSTSTLTVTVDGQSFSVTVAVGASFSTLQAAVAELASKIDAVAYTASVDATSKIINITAGAGVAAISTTLVNVTSGSTAISAADTGLSLVDNAAQSNVSGANNANIVLRNITGNILATNSISTVGSGNVLVQASAGNLTLNNSVGGGSGHVTLLSSGSQTYAAAGDVSTTGGTIDVQASDAGSSIGMNADTVFQTNGGNIRVMTGTGANAGGSITLGLLDARVASDRSGLTLAKQADGTTPWGSVSVTSTGGSILDNASDTAINIYANQLRLNAALAIGSGSNHLETEVLQISASAATGGLFVTESSAITVGQTAAIAVNRVALDASVSTGSSTDAVQTRLTIGGALVLQTTAGSLTTETTGEISAGADVLLRAGVGLVAAVDSGNTSQVLITAAAGSAAIAVSFTSGVTGSAVVSAADSSNVNAARSIDFSAVSVLLNATYTVTIGALSFSYQATVADTRASIVSALATRINASQILAADVDLRANLGSAGNISIIAGRSVLQKANITASTAAKTVDVQAVAAVTMNDGTVLMTNGAHVRIMAGTDITVGQVDTRAYGGGSVLQAQSNWGSVSLISSSGSILDNASENVAGTVDVYANALRLNAMANGKSVGSNLNALETEVSKLSASVGATAIISDSGAYISEATDISIGQTAALTVNRVGGDGSTLTDTTDAAQSDLLVTGNLVLQTAAGSIVVGGRHRCRHPGYPGDQRPCVAQGSRHGCGHPTRCRPGPHQRPPQSGCRAGHPAKRRYHQPGQRHDRRLAGRA
jgi:hypothetical protein